MVRSILAGALLIGAVPAFLASGASLAKAATELVLQCKTYDTSKPPKLVFQTTFTIDKAHHRFKILDKPVGQWDKDDPYELGDGTEWNDMKVDKDAIWWEDEVAHFELDLATGKGSYLGMDGVFNYECDKF